MLRKSPGPPLAIGSNEVAFCPNANATALDDCRARALSPFVGSLGSMEMDSDKLNSDHLFKFSATVDFVAPLMSTCSPSMGVGAPVIASLHAHVGVSKHAVNAPLSMPTKECPSSARVLDFQHNKNPSSDSLQPGVASQGSMESMTGHSLSFWDILVRLHQGKFKSASWDARPMKAKTISKEHGLARNNLKPFIRKAPSSHVLVLLEKLKKEVEAGEKFFLHPTD